jgi:NAD(P)-dependent dehydrogenase (short-subunit alcohol dehydrogenase family)
MTFLNRTAVVTGATGGLGSFVSHVLAERNANLALLDHNSEKLSSLTKSLNLLEDRFIAFSVDLLDADDTRSAAEAIAAKFGRVDFLLHLVGGWTGGRTILDASPNDLSFMLNQHVWTSFNVTRAFVPHLVSNGWGRIVMITSPFASRPNAKGGPYAIGKSGQEALMLTLSQELKGTGVTANLLQARTIDVRGEKGASPSPENTSWTTLDELTSAILYLLSDHAGTINGAKIPLFGSYN